MMERRRSLLFECWYYICLMKSIYVAWCQCKFIIILWLISLQGWVIIVSSVSLL
jgi:hypothetical protein